MLVAAGERFGRTLVLSADDIRAGGLVLHDLNPLHHDEAAARAAGYATVSASGAHTGGILMAMTATHFSQPTPAGHARRVLGLGFEIRFSAPVFAGEAVDYVWTVDRATWKPSLAGWVTELTGGATTARGPVLRATGRVLVRPPA